MTQSHAFVWQYGSISQAGHEQNTLKIRLLNPSNNPRHPLPLGTLIPTSLEPALLVVMPVSGKIIYWESLSIAANRDANRQRQQSVQGTVSGMFSGEVILDITEAEPRGFILTMNTGRLAHLSINDFQGRSSVKVQFLRDNATQGSGVFGSLRNVFSPSAWKKDVAAVKAAHSVQRGQRYIITANSSGTFQVWDVNWNGMHTLSFEVDAKEDMLAAISEGGQVPSDVRHYVFEVVTFAVISGEGKGSALVSSSSSFDCRVLALTELGGSESSKFALIGLILSSGSATIEVIHPISCYNTPTPSETRPKPEILISESTETAYVVFEKSIVLISLAEAEESPDSQLQIEAHTLPDPFQDVFDFRRDKPYRVVGCSMEQSDKQGSSSIIIMVFGFGLIRVTSFSLKTGQSLADRSIAKAQTKIEQAIFFGSLRQDLLDFTPRSEEKLEADDVEKAALNISLSIANSTSKYIPTMGPSMEQQLSRKASALADLNRHLRQYYPPLSRLGRWKLLWIAERMASANALWKVYQASMNNPDRTENDKNVFVELVEAIHTNYKNENQPEKNETDGVRHYFIHDVWRLEWIAPYAEEIVELLFKESIEDNEEFDLATRAKLAIDATDIQLAAIETAFKFREANAAVYGLQDESLIDGVLENDYQGLPEIWTSTLPIVSKIKMLADISREIAIALDEPSEDVVIDDALYERLSIKLAVENPRQVQLCCQTYRERCRWLASRDDLASKDQASALWTSYLTVREGLLTKLPEIGQTDAAINLAEKYRDMEALVEIIDSEMRIADGPAAQEDLLTRINDYFEKYGRDWANAFFTKHLEGSDSVRVLTQNASYKDYLTKFLRSHEDYAKVGWINEVLTEDNYDKASDFLGEAKEQTSNLWSQKIALSMQKLTLLAAKSQSKAKSKISELNSSTGRIDQSLSILSIQDQFFALIKSSVSDALDLDAEVDLTIQRHAPADKPAFNSLLRTSLLPRFFENRTLDPPDLIELLTLVQPDPIGFDDPGSILSLRFLSALQVLYFWASSSNETKPTQEVTTHYERLIWRRCYIADDWTTLNHTEARSDEQVTETTSYTSLYRTLLAGFRQQASSTSSASHSFWDTHPPIEPTEQTLLDEGTSRTDLEPYVSHLLHPTSSSQAASDLDTNEASGSNPVKSYPNPQSNSSKPTQTITITDLSSESSAEATLLSNNLTKGRLGMWFHGILDSARAAARTEQDTAGENIQAQLQVEKEMNIEEQNRRKGTLFTGVDRPSADEDQMVLGLDGANDFDPGSNTGVNGYGNGIGSLYRAETDDDDLEGDLYAKIGGIGKDMLMGGFREEWLKTTPTSTTTTTAVE